jgi:hypothetical protein
VTKKEFKMLDVVAVLHDHPKLGLVAGEVGTIVEIWKPGVFEVEFCDNLGQTVAMAAFPEKELMRLVFAENRPAAPASAI